MPQQIKNLILLKNLTLKEITMILISIPKDFKLAFLITGVSQNISKFVVIILN